MGLLYLALHFALCEGAGRLSKGKAETTMGEAKRRKLQEMGRLALRAEGENWNAYYAEPNTMEGAIFLGSILMATVVNNPERKKAFMELMQDIVAEYLKAVVGEQPTWLEPHSAPEHEKAGRA